ncbi:MAG: HAD-IA family hydrolase [Burkholderiales bacterium]|nr:HAD-IA family hydrolase [Burkholderiales bacterium]
MRRGAILFDLDGTLVDSAPDLAGAANELRALHGRPPLPLEAYRPLAGSGARGMLAAGFGLLPSHPDYPSMRAAFLSLYERRLLQSTTVFSAVLPVLARLEESGRSWGIVTNKALYLAEPLLAGVRLRHRAAVVVGGDSTPHLKPHPAPLLHAAHVLGVDAADCVYVGDDPRDMQAGRAAGMAALAASWGYMGPDARLDEWGADAVLRVPDDLLNWLGLP